MYDLKDKVVLITGAANGIGAAISREVMKEGAKHLRILDIDEKAGIQLENDFNNKYGANKAKFVKCDVTKDEQLFDAFNDTKQEQGYLDVVFNNAGIANETTYALIRKMIEINVIALINGTLKAVELMDKNNGGRGGTVINMSSVAGLYSRFPPLYIYSTSKSAVLQFSSCIGKVQPEDIRILTLCLGPTDTEIFDCMSTFGKAGNEVLADVIDKNPKQSVESAAIGAIEAYKKGGSASVWLIQKNNPAEDITEHEEKCYEIIDEVLSR